jgi:hypothetical protein
VCAHVQAYACAVYYSRVRVNKTGDSVRVVVAIAWGIDTRAGCVDHSLTGHEPEPKPEREN